MGRLLKLKHSLVLLIIFLASNIGLNPDISLGSFSVDVGDTYEYLVHEAFIDSSLGDEFYYRDGIYVELYRIPVSSVVTIEVDEVSTTSVVYTLSSGSLNHHDTCEQNILTPFLKLLAHGITMPNILLEHWNSIHGGGFEWIGDAFLETDADTWMFLEELNSTFETSHQSTSEEGAFFEIDFISTEENNEFSIEWFVDGSYAYTTTEYNLEYSYSGSIAYDMDSGILLGIHLLGSAQGLVGSKIFDVSFEYFVEARNYNLPGFVLRETSNQLTGFHWEVILGGLLLSFSISKLRKKEKRSYI